METLALEQSFTFAFIASGELLADGKHPYAYYLTILIILVAVRRYAASHDIDKIIVLAQASYISASTRALLRGRIDETPLLRAMSDHDNRK